MTSAPAAPTYLDARPTLEVADLGAALAFFTDVAGFAVDVTMGEPPTFAMVSAGPAGLGLVAVARPALPEGAACYLTVRGLDALVARLEAAGLELAVPVTTRPWGLRDLVVACPGGGPLLAFGEPVDG
jgi:predicted enzyme related to lactoylglutathione lyase